MGLGSSCGIKSFMVALHALLWRETSRNSRRGRHCHRRVPFSTLTALRGPGRRTSGGNGAAAGTITGRCTFGRVHSLRWHL